jgi:hypothetical protein
MRRKLLLGLITIIITSCGADHTDFSGDWIEKKNENDRMIIKKNGDNYIVNNRGKKYPAQIKDGLLEISTEVPIKATIDDSDNLIVSGNEYIRIEKSKLNDYLGEWVASECSGVSRTINIRKENNNIFISTLDGWKIVFENVRYRNKELNFKGKMWESDQENIFRGKFKLLDNGELQQTSSSSQCTYTKK